MVTFPVNDVSKKETYYKAEAYLKPLEDLFGRIGKFEAMGGPDKVLQMGGPRNGLYTAFQLAYCAHRTLVLSPDHIWLAIARVVAKHITSNAEALRKKFVDFEGQEYLEVERHQFVKGSPNNDWPGAFDEFAAKIDRKVHPDVVKTMSCDFSTSGPLERAVSRIVLMDAMSKYFRYGMITCSGIPQITLLGERDDWLRVQAKALRLEDFGMAAWLETLIPFLDEFVLAAGGSPDPSWWQSIYIEHGGSGVESFNGHLTTLFPKDDFTIPREVEGDKMPEAFSKVPMLWKYHGQEFRMQLVAGVPFATILDDGAITPAAAWGVEELP